MDDAVTVWTVIKRFLIGWALAGFLLVIVSYLKYRDYVDTVFANSAWAWLNVAVPIVLVVCAVVYVVRSIFR